MEVVDHDDRQRQAAPRVLARHAEQLVLGAVPELGLPEPAAHSGSIGAWPVASAYGAQDFGWLPAVTQ